MINPSANAGRLPIKPNWIAVDWGTSNLRVWAMGDDGILGQATSDAGMGKLSRDAFEPELLRLIEPWLGGEPVPVIACGMVGSRQGWHEAPYRVVPCTPVEAGTLVTVPTKDPRIQMLVVPGLKQTKHADVMRGEEVQIAGTLALLPGFDGAICLPGTHSKWVHVSAGEVVSFQTYLTGEMFALLSEQSVLRHGISPQGWDEVAFDAGVSSAFSHPEKLAAYLFTIRAEGLIAGLPATAARSRLSGLLIGAELAASKPYWLGQRVLLVGSTLISASYSRALAAFGVQTENLDVTACTLSGLAKARGVMQGAFT